MFAVLSDGDLPREHPGDFTLLRLCDGDGRHPGDAARGAITIRNAKLAYRLFTSTFFPYILHNTFAHVSSSRASRFP